MVQQLDDVNHARCVGSGPQGCADLQDTARVRGHNQIDVRLTRNFPFGRTRLQAQFDVYNLMNANTVLNQNTRYGTLWRVPSAILDPRLVKFGVQMNF